MNKIIDMNSQELRSIVEDAYQRVAKDSMLSNELKELLNFTENGKAWGGLVFRLMRENIVVKDGEKPIKHGSQRYFSYKLVKAPEVNNTNKQENEEFVIFNETTKEYEIILGSMEIDKKIESLLAKEDYVLRIFKLVEIAKPRRTIDRNKFN